MTMANSVKVEKLNISSYSVKLTVGVLIIKYSGTPLNWHPSKVGTHDITDNSESPDCPSIRFNT